MDRFPLVSVKVAGDGRFVKAMRITCSCGHTNDLLIKTKTPMPPDQAAQHFAQRGWVIGRNASFDLCPSCVAAELALRKAPRKDELMTKPSLADQLKAAVVPEPAAPEGLAGELIQPGQRVITRADRRRIMDVLDRVYPEPEKGYATGYTDQRVGEEMKVPWRWITLVREECYGPAIVVNWTSIERRQGELEKLIKSECESMLTRFAELERMAASERVEIDKLKKAVGK